MAARSSTARAETHLMRWWTMALAASGLTRRRHWARTGIVALVTLLCLGVGGSSAARQRAQATVYTGYGFDTCEAPTTATLTAWLASPYRALGIYIGGVNRACANSGLTSTWVAAAAAGGWNLL